MKRSILLGGMLVLGVACANRGRIHDPTEGAIHLPRIGQTNQYGRADDARPVAGADAPTRPRTSGPHGGDIDQLQRLAEDRWASRARHEEVDGVDVPATFDRMRDAMGRGTEDPAFTRGVRQTLCRLGDGNFRLDERSAGSRPMASGLEVHAVAESYVVWDASRDLYGKKPRRGDLIVKADGKPIAQWVEHNCVVPGSTPAHRQVNTAHMFERQWRLPEEKPQPRKLTLRRGGGGTYKLGLKWRVRSEAGADPTCVSGRQLEGRVGVLTIDSFDCPDVASFERQLRVAIDEMGKRPRDVIIDVRDNAGGDAAAAKAAAYRFLEQAPAWSRLRRHAPGATVSAFSDQPYRPPDDVRRVKAKRIWVLTGPGCSSTCEVFVAVMSTADDVTLVGRPTAGSVGDPKPVRLEGSGLRVHVPSTEYAIPGTFELIEAKGIAPNVLVSPTLDDVMSGRDAELDATVRRVSDE